MNLRHAFHVPALCALLSIACGDGGSDTGTTTGDSDTDSNSNSASDSVTMGVTLSGGSMSATTTDASSDSSATDASMTASAGSSDGSTGNVDGSSSSGAADGSSSSGGSSSGGDMGNTIYEIQDGTIAEDTAVEVYGVVVTAVNVGGFWAQEPGGGEYSGVQVFSGMGGPDVSGVQVGDIVDFSGTTNEFFEVTQVVITDGTFDVTGSTTPPDAELLPIATLVDGTTGEPWESVLVRIEGTLTAGMLSMFDEFPVADGPDSIIIDNFAYSVSMSGDFPGFGTGATFDAIQGPLNFSFMNYKIAPRDADDLEGYQAP